MDHSRMKWQSLGRVWVMLGLILFWGGVQAGDGKPKTTDDPTIPPDKLELLLEPLTEEELRIEAEGWMDLLIQKVRELSTAQLAVKSENEMIEKIGQVQELREQIKGEKEQKTLDLEKAKVKEVLHEARDVAQKARRNPELQKVKADALKQPRDRGVKERDTSVTAEDKALKHKLLERINKLRNERTALIKRVELVLAAWEAKGGDPEVIEKYRKYISVVSGVKVDVSDTMALWATIKGWITAEQGGIRWAKNLAAFVVTVLAFWFLAKFLGKVTSRAFHVSRGGSALLRDFTVKAVRRVTILIGIIVGLSALEINIGPLLALIGAVGFVIALALQDSLSNFASGILMLLYRPFDVGDVVEAGGVAGTVTNLTLFSTHIKTFDNKAMIVPNNQVWGGVITNATGTDMRRVDMVFGIGYGDDIDHAQKVLEDIVSNHELVLRDPAPVIRVHELADSSVNFICRPWTRPADYWAVYWEITRAVKKRFDEEGISIPFPQRDVHIHQADASSGGSSVS